MQARNSFEQFTRCVSQIQGIDELLIRSESQYNLKKYKITEICDNNALPIYQHIVDKFYKNHDLGDSTTWVENELRLFIWTVLCYLQLHNKSINSMKQRDWMYFGQIFYIKEGSLFEYQARTLLDLEAKMARWTEEEDYLLYQIIIRDKNAKWNEIAKSLYISSDKKYLRPSKQCRQRWLNHLDPNKAKTCWSINQFLVLFEHVEEKGKKWALLVRKLNGRRGQHSIKNKYNSIIKKQGRLSTNLTENQIRKQITVRLNRILQTQTLDQNDQFVLGLSSKTKASYLFEANPSFYNRGNQIVRNDSLKKKFDDFRKKIQKFSCNAVENRHPQQPHHQNYQVNSRMSSLISKFSPQTLSKNSQVYEKPIPKLIDKPQKIKQDESIFYEDSYCQESGMIALGYKNNQILLAEEINNFINQSELDI